MSELENHKQSALIQVQRLCAHCVNSPRSTHDCPIREITQKIRALSGIPLIVDNEFRGVLCA